jgi:hypothetical protein
VAFRDEAALLDEEFMLGRSIQGVGHVDESLLDEHRLC